MASARVQRCALILSAYNHKVQYVPGKEHTNADLLSWLPLPEEPKEIPMPEESVLLLATMELSPVTMKQIKTCMIQYCPQYAGLLNKAGLIQLNLTFIRITQGDRS